MRTAGSSERSLPRVRRCKSRGYPRERRSRSRRWPMLGGDREFQDKVCWALMVPVALFALVATDLVIMGLEIAVEADVSDTKVWAVPLMALCGGFSFVFLGAKT